MSVNWNNSVLRMIPGILLPRWRPVFVNQGPVRLFDRRDRVTTNLVKTK